MVQTLVHSVLAESPLAEGRELKFAVLGQRLFALSVSPLAEGRELKLELTRRNTAPDCRPSRRGVN